MWQIRNKNSIIDSQYSETLLELANLVKHEQLNLIHLIEVGQCETISCHDQNI